MKTAGYYIIPIQRYSIKKVLVFITVIIFFIYSSCSGTKKPSGLLRDKIPPPSEILGTLVVIEGISSPSVPSGSSNLPFIQFAMATNQSEIALKSIKFEQTGSFKDTDIKSIKLYLDDGNDILDPTKDILLSSAQFTDGACSFQLDQPIINRPQLFFISVDLSSQASGTISFLFTAESFGTTDILGVVGKYPFTASATIATPSDSGAKVTEPPSPVSTETPQPTAPSPKIDKSSEEQPSLDPLKQAMSELEKEKSVKIQENEFLAQKYYEMALKLFKEFNYRQARDKIDRALELNPHHQDAKKLLNEIQLILGSRAEEIKVIKDFLQNQLTVKIQETEIIVRNHFLNGEKLISDKKYPEAIVEFESVINKLKWIPYEVGLKEYLKKAQERIKQINDLIVRHEEAVMRQRREAAVRIAQEEELKRQQEHNERIRTLFREALVFFEQKRFDEVERLANTILKLAPTFYAALELKKEAMRVRHYKVSADYLTLRTERFKALYDDLKETIIPYADDRIVRYDPDVWEIASKRQIPGTVTAKIEEDPDIVDIKRKLKTIKHDFKLDGTISLYEVTNYIQQQYKIPIIYASDIRQEGIPDEKKSLSLIGLPLEVGLKNLLELYKLFYTFNRDFKCLWITRIGSLEEELEWRVYNVEDLVRAIPEFPGPNIETALTPGGAPGWQAPSVELPTAGSIPAEEIIELIKKNTGKDRRGTTTWEIPGINIKKIGDSNKLMIVQTRSAHDEIMEFLQIIRSFRTAMIAIEATFLSTTDNILEDLNIQLRDIPGSPMPGAPAVPGQASPGSGVLASNRRGADLRFRTAYTFRDATGAVETPLPPTASGGLGLQFAVFGKPRINMLLTALEKKGKGIIIDSPKIVALNGQRVNVSFIRQRQYIQDGDIQSGAVAYEPIINTFSVGVVLDVKPVMSYDRKFITVHIFPTLLELVSMRYRTLTYAAPPSVTQINIEMPWLRLQRCRTTAIVPDKGALVLGGLKTIYNIDAASSTPLLEKLPVLGVFFKHKVKSEEKLHQTIIVRAEIIELPEIEENLQ